MVLSEIIGSGQGQEIKDTPFYTLWVMSKGAAVHLDISVPLFYFWRCWLYGCRFAVVDLFLLMHAVEIESHARTWMAYLLNGAIICCVSCAISRQCDLRHAHLNCICEGFLLTTGPKPGYNCLRHVVGFENVPLCPVLLRSCIAFLYKSKRSLSHTHTPCKLTTQAQHVLIWCVLLQGQHVHCQYWTGRCPVAFS